MDSVVRLCLDQLDQPHRAFAIVRENASRWVGKNIAPWEIYVHKY